MSKKTRRGRRSKRSRDTIPSLDTLFDERIYVSFSNINDSQATLHTKLQIVRKDNGIKEWRSDLNGGVYQPFIGAYDTLSKLIGYTGLEVPSEQVLYKKNKSVYKQLEKVRLF